MQNCKYSSLEKKESSDKSALRILQKEKLCKAGFFLIAIEKGLGGSQLAKFLCSYGIDESRFYRRF